MHIKARGIVLRKTAVSESSGYLTVFTDKLGTISVMARGINKKNSKYAASTQIMSCVDFVLFSHKNGTYYLDSATLVEPFIKLRSDIVSLSMASYFGEILTKVFDEGQGSDRVLSLMLNCLHLLCEGSKSHNQIKGMFEFKIMALAGFAPDIVACKKCGKYEGEMFLDYKKGTICCAECGGTGEQLPPAVLKAMRHILFSDDKDIYAFNLAPPADKSFQIISERWLHAHADQNFKTLEFLKGVMQ